MHQSAARRKVERYADRDGWTSENGDRIAACQRCAESKNVRALFLAPVTEHELLMGDGPSICVCARCRNYLRTVGRVSA